MNCSRDLINCWPLLINWSSLLMQFLLRKRGGVSLFGDSVFENGKAASGVGREWAAVAFWSGLGGWFGGNKSAAGARGWGRLVGQRRG